MRKPLESAFDQPIDPTDGAQATRLFEQRAGVFVGAAHDLAKEIGNDLDSQKCGIGWWAPFPDDKRRIFIADYLFQCASSVTTNLVEAALHLFEMEAAFEAYSARLSHSLKIAGRNATGYKLKFEFPRYESGADLVPEKLLDLHVAGFFRGVGSTMDTLAAVAAGVGAFEEDILKVQFRSFVANLRSQVLPATAGGQLQERIRDAIGDAVTSAGPDGWLNWALDYRNMLVHRGRRRWIWALEADAQPIVLDSRSVPIPRTRVVLHLARDPRNSDLQAHFGGGVEPDRLWNLLEEDGIKTLRETLEGVTFVVKSTCKVLVGVWRDRRAAPDKLAQPRAQWPKVSVRPDQFTGFEPGTVPVDPQAMQSSPVEVQRLCAAAILNDAQRSRWRTFTG